MFKHLKSCACVLSGWSFYYKVMLQPYNSVNLVVSINMQIHVGTGCLPFFFCFSPKWILPLRFSVPPYRLKILCWLDHWLKLERSSLSIFFPCCTIFVFLLFYLWDLFFRGLYSEFPLYSLLLEKVAGLFSLFSCEFPSSHSFWQIADPLYT